MKYDIDSILQKTTKYTINLPVLTNRKVDYTHFSLYIKLPWHSFVL